MDDLNPDALEMEIFKAGDYGVKGRYSEADIQALAEDYKPGLLEAPLTFDHARSGPAYGWVAALRRSGDRLIAVLKDVPSTVRDVLRNGLFKRRSVELMRELPETGRPYLRAVTLLGAATPEVKGLREIAFSGDSADDVFFFEEEAAARPDNGGEAIGGNDSELWRRRAQDMELNVLFRELQYEGYCLSDDDCGEVRRAFFETENRCDVFSNACDQRVGAVGDLLRRFATRVPLGVESAPGFTASSIAKFAENFEPKSAELHERALALQKENSDLLYRDALLMVADVSRY